MTVITCIEDLRILHEKRTPRMFYDYVDSGSWTESTYRRNNSAFMDYKFRQRVLVDVDNRSLKSKMLGQNVSMPVALAPVGLTGMQWVNGEIRAARAAERRAEGGPVRAERCGPVVGVHSGRGPWG